MNIKAASALNNKQINTSHFLSHADEPIDRYSEYLSQGPQASDGRVNPRNLFDDSNKTDRKWLKNTREYLSRLKG